MGPTNSPSTTEAEYIIVTEGAKELLWMKGFINDLGFEQPGYILFCDNESDICLTKHSNFHSKTKHINTKYHWIIIAVEEKLFEVEKIHTEFCRKLAGMKSVNSSST